METTISFASDYPTHLIDYFNAYDSWLKFIEPAFGLDGGEWNRIERATIFYGKDWIERETDYLDSALHFVQANRSIAQLAKSAFLKLWFTIRASEDFGYRLHSFITGGLGDVPSLLNAVETWAERQTWTQRNGCYWMPAKIIDWLKDNTELHGNDLLWALKRVLKAQRSKH